MNTSRIVIIVVNIIVLLIIQILHHPIINTFSISIRIIDFAIIVSLTINPLVFPCFWGLAGLVFGVGSQRGVKEIENETFMHHLTVIIILIIILIIIVLIMNHDAHRHHSHYDAHHCCHHHYDCKGQPSQQ